MTYSHCPHEQTGTTPPPWMCMPCWGKLTLTQKLRFYQLSSHGGVGRIAAVSA